MEKMKAGWIQFLKDRPDYWELAEKAAKIGYQATESEADLIKGDLRENAKHLKDLGLRLLTVRAAKIAELTDDMAGKVERARIWGCDRVTAFSSSMTNSFNGKPGTYDEMMKDFETVNKAVDFYAKEGLHVCYHNHFQEFADRYKGASCFEHMLINCDERLKFDIDVGWVHAGGYDPVKLLDRLGERNLSIHVKDFYDISNPVSLTGFTSLGTGLVDIKGVLKKAAELGVRWAVVEQDKLRNLNLMDTMAASYYYMKETGFVE
jgi:sugar phosphate isomerase/epimerase